MSKFRSEVMVLDTTVEYTDWLYRTKGIIRYFYDFICCHFENVENSDMCIKYEF